MKKQAVSQRPRAPAAARAVTVLLTLGASMAVQAQPAESETWLPWGARVRLGVPAAESLRAAQPVHALASSESLPAGMLLGDYYFDLRAFGLGNRLRATGGVLMRSRQFSLADLAAPAAATLGVVRAPVQAAPALTARTEGEGAQPYLGLGYSYRPQRSAWAFSADVGMLGQGAGGPPVRLGRAHGASRAVEDALNEWRLGPALQLGVQYSF